MFHRVWSVLVQAMTSWHQGKLFIEHSLSFNHDSLHVFAGMLLWLLFGVLLRRPLTRWRPWLCVFAVILWNETVDLWVEQWPDPGQQYGEGVRDLVLTMFLPTLLMWAARVRPGLFRGAPARRRR
jgi:hypothetical protein